MPRLIAPLAPVAFLLFSGMVYQATASNAYNVEKAEAAGVQSLVTDNCRPGKPASRVYDQIGVDTHVAGGIIVRPPERLREVCRIVNRSHLQVAFRELEKSRSLADFGKVRADNTQLLQLAADLHLTKEDATNLVRAHGRKVLEHRAPAIAQPSPAETADAPTPAMSSSIASTRLSSGLSLPSGSSGLQLSPFSSSLGL